MDIGVPLRDLGAVETAPLRAHLEELGDDAWTNNTFRQDALADGAHSTTQAILFKHEWNRSYNTAGFQYLEDLVYSWATHKRLDPDDYMPLYYEETDIGSVYTFPEWNQFKLLVTPIVVDVLRKLGSTSGAVTRLALVKMMPGKKIDPHVDGQMMARKAHRIHISITSPIGVEYKISGKKFKMKAGHAYDFNNCVRHSVRHSGRHPRINLFIDYYANPGPPISNPFSDLGPVYASRVLRAVEPWN